MHRLHQTHKVHTEVQRSDVERDALAERARDPPHTADRAPSSTHSPVRSTAGAPHDERTRGVALSGERVVVKVVVRRGERPGRLEQRLSAGCEHSTYVVLTYSLTSSTIALVLLENVNINLLVFYLPTGALV